MSPTYALMLASSAALVAGCDEHHAHVDDPHHHAHYDEHADHHSIVVERTALPTAPAHPPPTATGPGRWLWDPQRGDYVWLQQ